jgi:acyl carrier protein
MMENKLRRILASILEIDENEIDENTDADDVGNWDSLKQMMIIVTLEEEFNIEFDDEEIIFLMSYQSILNSIKRKIQK